MSTPSPPTSIPARSLAVAAAHEAIDLATRNFRDATGIACPSGCGRCCLSPQVETTAADFLPLALHLCAQGAAWEMLEQLLAHGDEPRCALYRPEPGDPDRGRCSQYARRPAICRLFGFAGRRDADGRPNFVACRVHRETQPSVVAEVQCAVIERRLAIPIMSDLAGQVTSVAEGGLARLEPINAALRRALEYTLLHDRLSSGERDDDQPDATTPHRPTGRAA